VAAVGTPPPGRSRSPGPARRPRGTGTRAAPPARAAPDRGPAAAGLAVQRASAAWSISQVPPVLMSCPRKVRCRRTSIYGHACQASTPGRRVAASRWSARWPVSRRRCPGHACPGRRRPWAPDAWRVPPGAVRPSRPRIGQGRRDLLGLRRRGGHTCRVAARFPVEVERFAVPGGSDPPTADHLCIHGSGKRSSRGSCWGSGAGMRRRRPCRRWEAPRGPAIARAG
jgi:hypothetical protein